MRHRCAIRTATTAAVLASAIVAARADAAAYPDWEGQWERTEGGQFDPSKPPGLPQRPPLTEEYQAIWEANLRESAFVEKSPMPSYKDKLTHQELSDLVSYLVSLKGVEIR